MFTVYSLIDPRDHSIRYIGITEDVYQRMRQHSRCEGNNAAKNAWIRELQKLQLMFVMHSIEQVKTVDQALSREAYWIDYYLKQGANLTNIAGISTLNGEQKQVRKFRPYVDDDITKIFFKTCIGRVISVQYATHEEFDAFVKQYASVEDENDGTWSLRQRRRFINWLYKHAIEPVYCDPVDIPEEEKIFIKLN